MRYNIQNLLHLELEPVGIFYCDKAPDHALSLRRDKRNCVADMLMGAARGKTIVMDEETCSCAGAQSDLVLVMRLLREIILLGIYYQRGWRRCLKVKK